MQRRLEFIVPPNSFATVSNAADIADRTVIRTFLESTNPVGTRIHGSSSAAKIKGAVI